MDRHGKDGFIFLELENHFVEEAEDSELSHIFDVEVNLFEVFFIQYKLLLIEAENVLGREYDFRE
jgi:hypothetical protein